MTMTEKGLYPPRVNLLDTNYDELQSQVWKTWVAYLKNWCTMPENVQQLITYSEKYLDDLLEYRHVILPPALVKLLPKNHLMTETEWRNLGVQQSPGWVHYMIHKPEPHILLFKRPRTDRPRE